MNDSEAKERVIEVDLIAPATPQLLAGIEHRLRLRSERRVARLTAAALVVGLGLLSAVLFIDFSADDGAKNGENTLAKDGDEAGDAAEDAEPYELFPELGKMPVMIRNHAINPETGEETWRLEDELRNWLDPEDPRNIFVDYSGCFWHPEHEQFIASARYGSFDMKVAAEPSQKFVMPLGKSNELQSSLGAYKPKWDAEKRILTVIKHGDSYAEIPIPKEIEFEGPLEHPNDSIAYYFWFHDDLCILQREDSSHIVASKKEGDWSVEEWDAPSVPMQYQASKNAYFVRSGDRVFRVYTMFRGSAADNPPLIDRVGSSTVRSEDWNGRGAILTQWSIGTMEPTTGAVALLGPTARYFRSDGTEIRAVETLSELFSQIDRRLTLDLIGRGKKVIRFETVSGVGNPIYKLGLYFPANTAKVKEGEILDGKNSPKYVIGEQVAGFGDDIYLLQEAADQPEPDGRSQKATPDKKYHLSLRDTKGELAWQIDLMANPEIYLHDLPNGIVAIDPFGATFYRRSDGKKAWSWHQPKSRSSLVFGSRHGTNVTGLDNGKVLISYYSSGGSFPVKFILGDPASGEIKEFESEFEPVAHSEYHQHNYVVARKDQFVLVSDHPDTWYIEVRKSSDGSLVKRWTDKTYTPLKDVEKAPEGKRDEADKTAESEEKD